MRAVAAWCFGGAALTLAAAYGSMNLAAVPTIAVWVVLQLGLAGGAAWVRGLADRDNELAFLIAQALLILSALMWGGAAVAFGIVQNDFNLPLAITIVGLAVAAVWMFRAERLLMGGVLVVMLLPTLVQLFGARGGIAAAALAILMVVGNWLIARDASDAEPDTAPVPMANPAPSLAVRTVEVPAPDSELLQLRGELERHRNLEKEMELAKQSAEAANMAKGEFLATMSHEMRTPLNGIIPLLEILRDTKLEVDQREYLNTAYTSARHLLRIIDDILDYSKIEANKLELETVGLNLKEVVDSVFRLMERSADNKGLKISVSFDPNVRLACRGDPVRLRQVLSNLVSNAVKFTEKGSIAIQISKRGETRTHSEILFAVRDTGVGISPEKAEKLFQPFSQADTSTTRNYGGTGLGLVICKRIIELMGGKIGLKSELGKGSVFWFSVPMLKALGDVNTHRRDLTGARALIVSSDQRLTQRLSGQCQMWGMSQISTNTTADALSKLKSSATLGENWAFDVAIVDLGSMRTTAPALYRNVGREPTLERLKMVHIEGEESTPAELAGDAARSIAVKRQYSDADLMSALNRVLQVDAGGERRFNLLEEAARLGKEPAPNVEVAPSTGETAKLGGHALLVEDNPVNRQVAQRLLGLIGITLEVAENGKEAFDLMGRGGFDVVLMDCQMPVMDGYTATRSRRTLEQEKNLPRIPIIAMTANAMAGDREKCLASGMDDYMSKPLNRGLLEQTIRKWMPKGKRAEPAAAPLQQPTPAPVSPLPTPAPAVQPQAAPPQANPAPVPTRLSEPVRLTPQAPAINESIVNELIDVMGSEFTSLVKVYLEDTPKNLQILNSAAERGDVQAMIAPAHSLKSTSANLGAMALSDLAKLIEHGARSGTLRDTAGMARQASIEFRRAADELQRLLTA
mgnify:CR=1 FL=1